MRFKFNPKYTQIAVYAVIVIVVSGILLMFAQVMPDFNQLMDNLFSAIAPILWGCVIAYLLNPGVDFFRFKVFKKQSERADTVKKRNLIRNISLFITVVLAIGAVTGLLFLIIPQVVKSVTGIVDKFDVYAENILNWAHENFGNQPQIIAFIENPLDQIENYLNNSWSDISKSLLDFGTVVGGSVLDFILGFKDFIIGFIIAIYIISSKDMLKAQAKKFIFAFFRNNTAQRILNVTRHTNDIFIHYITGVLIDAFFVGCVTFIGASLIGTPYPLLMAATIACTNIIPFFGPFIGGIPTCFLVLLVDPMKALWFGIFLVVLQQFDGNIMVPLIQGDRTGVPSIWVLVGIIVGGGLFGFAGMLLGVPVFAVIYMLFKEFLNSKLEKKKLPSEGTLYNRDDVDKFVNGYEYSEEERLADKKWLESLSEEKKEKQIFRREGGQKTKASEKSGKSGKNKRNN